MKLLLHLSIGLIYFLPVCSKAQDQFSDKYSFKVEREKKSRKKIKFPRADTLFINFDYGYRNDIVSIRSGDTIFNSPALNADNVYGFGGWMKIPKDFLRKTAEVLLNGRLVAILKINLKYSSVHLQFNREAKSFTWRYHRYKFGYL